jgi:hypothetical protein
MKMMRAAEWRLDLVVSLEHFIIQLLSLTITSTISAPLNNIYLLYTSLALSDSASYRTPSQLLQIIVTSSKTPTHPHTHTHTHAHQRTNYLLYYCAHQTQ